MVALMAKKKTKPTAIGVRIRVLREAKGMSLAELGQAIGNDRQFVYRLETSPTANPTAETIMKLVEALGCTPNDLLGTSGRDAD